MHFPRLDVGQIKIKPIEKGGSDRNFYRIRCSEEQSLILVKYNLEREENRHYVPIAKFLDTHGIRVPKIYFHDPAEGLIWIEDLGKGDLYDYRMENWLVRRAFYESALDQIATLHAKPRYRLSGFELTRNPLSPSGRPVDRVGTLQKPQKSKVLLSSTTQKVTKTSDVAQPHRGAG